MESPDLLAALAEEGQELDVHLDVMTGYLLVVTLGVDFAHAGTARQAAYTVAAQNARYTRFGDFDVVIARQIPGDPD